jgi:hypothetical protein
MRSGAITNHWPVSRDFPSRISAEARRLWGTASRNWASARRGTECYDGCGGKRAHYILGPFGPNRQLTTLRAVAARVRPEDREETSGGRSGAEAGCLAASALADWRGL